MVNSRGKTGDLGRLLCEIHRVGGFPELVVYHPDLLHFPGKPDHRFNEILPVCPEKPGCTDDPVIVHRLLNIFLAETILIPRMH